MDFFARGVCANERQELEAASKFYRRGAESEQATGARAACQTHLGGALLYARGVARNEKEAAKWFRRAVEHELHPDDPFLHKVAEAHTMLGVLLEDGRGVKRDYVAAARHYRAAIALGDSNGGTSAVNLAFVLDNGRPGVPQDRRESVRLLKLAIATDEATPGRAPQLALIGRHGLTTIP